MKKKIVCVGAIALVLIVFVLIFPTDQQEFINEDEFEARLASDPEAVIAGVEANTTVVIPAPDKHECRFAILCKKVKYDDGHTILGATVTLVSSDYPILIRKGRGDWVDPPLTKTTGDRGIVCFLILWDSNPPESIVVTIKVVSGGYENKENVVLDGNEHYYKLKCILNTIPSPPSIPELELATPISTSIGAAAYFWFRKRRERKSYISQSSKQS